MHGKFVKLKYARLHLIAHMDIYAHLEFATNIVKSWAWNQRIFGAKIKKVEKTFAMEGKLIALLKQKRCVKASQIVMDLCGMVNGAKATKVS